MNWPEQGRLDAQAACGRVAVLGLLFLVVVAGLHDVWNGDLGFHLAAGRTILDTGWVPLHDPFSHSAGGRSWIDFQWLYDAGVYVLWILQGPAAVIAAHALANAATFGVLAWALFRRRGYAVWGFLVLLAVFVVAEVRFTVRPHALERLFLTLLLATLLRLRRAPDKPIWPLFALQVVWCNLHGSYLMAPGFAGLLFIDRLRDRVARRRMVLLTIGLTAASLVTPYGWRQVVRLIQHRAAVMRAAVNPEWMPVRLTFETLNDPAIWAVAALAVVTLVCLWRNSRAGLFEWVVYLFSVGGPFVHARLLPGSALQLALLLAACRWDSANAVAPQPSSRRWTPALIAGMAVLTFILALGVATDRYAHLLGRPSRTGLAMSAQTPGWLAGAYLAQREGIVEVFNSYRQGGWLSWWLSKRGGKVFIDGRDVGNVYTPWHLVEYRRLLQDPSLFDQKREDYGWDAVTLQHVDPLSGPLLRHLAAAAEWQMVYLDEVAVVFLPVTGVQNGSARGVELASTRWTPGTTDPLPLSGWSLGLSRMGMHEEARRGFQQTLWADPNDVAALTYLGTAHVKAGRLGEAVRLLEKAVSLETRNGAGHQNLAIAYFRSGKLERALHHGQLAARWRRHDEMAWSNLARYYLAANDYEKAAAARRRALELSGP